MNDFDFNDRAFLGNKIHKIHSLKYQVDTGPQDSMDLEVWRNCQNGKLQAFPELQYQILKKNNLFSFFRQMSYYGFEVFWTNYMQLRLITH